MERLKSMKESLMSCVQMQMGNLQQVDAKELGEAIDMIKDLEEAIYYGTITKAMEEKEHKGAEKEKEHHYYYSERYMYPEIYYRDMDREQGRMYFNEYAVQNYANGSGGGGSRSGGGSRGSSSSGSGSNSGSGSSRQFYEMEYPIMRDSREGRSPTSRKTYMEAKEMHHDKSVKLKELENYIQELTHDMVEMIEDASPEEKQFLEKKVNMLATKIGQLSKNG